MIDGQDHVDLRDADSRHDLGQVEHLIVVVGHGHARPLDERVVGGASREVLVVFHGFVPLCLNLFLGEPLDGIAIVGGNLSGLPRRDEAAHQRVGQQAQTQDEHDQYGGDLPHGIPSKQRRERARARSLHLVLHSAEA